MPWSRVLVALFVIYVIATAAHVGYVIHHEPFAFDAWNVAIDSGAKPISANRFLEFWVDQYTQSNPRLGQTFTYLAYKLEYFAEIATPLAYLALSLAITVLGLGRWPWRRPRDLALWAIAIGFGWFVLPQLGRNMFCRAYSANYVYTAVLQLWFLVPLRLSATGDASIPRCLAYGFAGVLVGMCNEHTGPVLIAFLLGYAGWLRCRGNPGRLVLAGFLGVIVGFAAIFFAPGQDQRYGELAQQVSLPMRLFQRGISGNLDILRAYIAYAAPLLVLIVIVLVAYPGRDEVVVRRARALRLVGLVLVAGAAMAATLFVSPKLGSRFYLVSMALLLASFIAVADGVLTTPRRLAPFVVLAIAASIYAGVRTIPLYRSVARQGAERMAALEATRPGALFVANAFDQVGESWWYIGDDFRDLRKREMVARYFALGRVVFRGPDLERPLGMAGVQLVPAYRVAGSKVAQPYATFDLGASKGFDVAGIHRSTRSSLATLQAEQPELAAFELRVAFAGAAPPLPRPNLLLSRWQAGKLEAYTARIARAGGGKTRNIVLPKELAGLPYDIFIVQVGGDARRLGTTDGGPLRYIPWRTGVYWVLACRDDICFVIAATRQAG